MAMAMAMAMAIGGSPVAWAQSVPAGTVAGAGAVAVGATASATGDGSTAAGSSANAIMKMSITLEQQALRDCRHQLGWSQPAMAARLGLNLSTLQSYEYGKTQQVPPQLLEKARLIAAGGKQPEPDAGFTSPNITEIAEGWIRRLHIRDGEHEALADVLSLPPGTVHAWFRNRVRADDVPSVREIRGYERVIAAVEKQIGGKIRSQQQRVAKAIQAPRRETRLEHLVRVSRSARCGGVGVLSTGEQLAAALVLNHGDWLGQWDYSIAEAIGRVGGDWVELIPEAARIVAGGEI